MSQTVYPASIASTAVVNSVTLTHLYEIPSAPVLFAWIPTTDYASANLDAPSNATEIGMGGFAMLDTQTSSGVDLIDAQNIETVAVPPTPKMTPYQAMEVINQKNRRAMFGTEITVSEPVAYKGVPRSPDVRMASNGILTLGSSSVDNDPDDDDDDDHVWRVSTLASPGDDEYWLEAWEEKGGGLTWESKYPYRPIVYAHSAFMDDNSEQVYSRAVGFDYGAIEHMWLDLGSGQSTMTVMVAAIFHGYPHSRFGHYVLDTGREPPVREGVLDGERYKIDDNVNHRATMLYKKNRSIASTNDNANPLKGKHIGAHHNSAHRARILFTVFNGDDSMHGYIDPKHKVHKEGKLAEHSIRHLVMGRARNRLDRDYSCHMTVFEIKIFERALNYGQIRRKAKRISGRYKLNRYWN